MPTRSEIVTLLLMVVACVVEIGAHFADRYIEGLITKQEKVSDNFILVTLLKCVTTIVALGCFLATLVECHFRAHLDGANQGIFLIYYYYPEDVEAGIGYRIYGSSAQLLTVLFAFLHLGGTIAYAVGIQGFRFAVVPLVMSIFQVAAKVVDCCRSHTVYLTCQVEGLRAADATHFRGSLMIDCRNCDIGCPHRDCGHCAPCVHCNRQEQEHDHAAQEQEHDYAVQEQEHHDHAVQEQEHDHDHVAQEQD